MGSRIFFQTHFYPLIKIKGQVNEIFLSFLTREKTELPVLLNVSLVPGTDCFEIHCGGMQISQRNRFEKELLLAKNIAEQTLLENDELIAMRAELQQNKLTLESQLLQLAQAHALQQEINKVLAHDLQEPLRKITMFSNQLLAAIATPVSDKAAQALNKIVVLVDRVRALLDSLQRFNSIDNAKLNYTEIELPEVVAKALRKANIKPGEQAIHIRIGAYPVFYADSKLLTDLCYELFVNSVRFRKAGKTALEIKLEAVTVMRNRFIELEGKYLYEPFVRLTVSDNGVGISSASDSIFRLFDRAHHSLQALGMGLAYCRRIVERHHGTIEVQSAEGSGTAFIIYLPLAPEKNQTLAAI